MTERRASIQKILSSKEATVKRTVIILLLLGCVAFAFGQEKREPYRAMLYSAVFPGGGQLYNQAWLKAGLVMGVQGYLIGSAIYHDGKRADFNELAENTQDSFLQQQYEARSKEYRDALNNDIWWIGITAGLSVIDAYVDAHLYDFESQKEKIRLRFEGDALSLQYRF